MRFSFLRNPVLHFLLLGVALFVGNRYIDSRGDFRVAYPSAERIQAMQDDWTRRSGRLPTQKQLDALIQAEIDADILFREALRRNMHRDDAVVYQRLLRDANFLEITGTDREKLVAVMELGVHESDEVVKRRLIQRMEMLAKSSVVTVASEAELLDLYESDRSRWYVPPKYALSHVFFSLDQSKDAAARARAFLPRLAVQEVPPDQAVDFGDPFLHGNQLPLQDIQALNFYFGAGFVDSLLQEESPVGRWLGPIASAYGYHLVFVREMVSERYKTFGEVQRHLHRLWREAKEREALQAFIADLHERYEVERSE